MSNGNETVDVSTKFFGIKLAGPNSLLIILFFLLMGNAALFLWENYRRELEHEQMACLIKLDLFVHVDNGGFGVDWRRMPADLFPCVPKFMYQQGGGT